MPLLRFKTSLQPETWSSLEDYAGRMKPDQKVIYYIVGEDPKSVLRSPHLDYFQAQGTEVLLLTEPMDSFMLMGLHKYKDFELKNVAQADLPEKPAEDEKGGEYPRGRFQNPAGTLQAGAGRTRCGCARQQPAFAIGGPPGRPAGRARPGTAARLQVSRQGSRDSQKDPGVEPGPPHPEEPAEAGKLDSALQNLVIEQIFDSALLVEGLHPDPSSMVPRVQQIMEAALGHAEPPAS